MYGFERDVTVFNDVDDYQNRDSSTGGALGEDSTWNQWIRRSPTVR